MSEQGDQNEKPRPIQHQITIKNNKDYENIRSELSNYGYVVSKNDDTINVLHIAPLQVEKIQKNIEMIQNICNQYHLEYKGWSAKVMK